MVPSAVVTAMTMMTTSALVRRGGVGLDRRAGGALELVEEGLRPPVDVARGDTPAQRSHADLLLDHRHVERSFHGIGH